MNKITGNLIRCDRVAQQEMIMVLNMNNVMDNNWVLFCIWRVQLPFLWLSSHSYFYAYQTTPTECTCARPTLRIRISSIISYVSTLWNQLSHTHYRVLDVSDDGIVSKSLSLFAVHRFYPIQENDISTMCCRLGVSITEKWSPCLTCKRCSLSCSPYAYSIS